MAEAVLLIGVSGVGKSTMAQAVGSYWSSRGHPTGVVDTDWLAQFGPKPPSVGGDRLSFHDRLKVNNLASVSRTFREAGAEYLVVSASPSSRHVADALISAIDSPTVIVELTADPAVVASRRSGRNGVLSDHPESHGNTPPVSAQEVARDAGALGSLGLADLVIGNDGPVDEVAGSIVRALEWS